MSEEANLMLIF